MTKSLSGKRLLVVEEVLKDPIGHWYEYVRSVAELNRAEGAEVTTVGHVAMEPGIAAELDAIAAFPQSRWDGVYAYPQAWRRYLAVFYHNWLVFRVMSRIVRDHGPFDLLFAPTVTVHHIWGWRLLLSLYGKRIGRMVLLFRFNEGFYPPGSSTPIFARSSVAIKWGMQSFARALKAGKAAFATDSTRLAREYQILTGITPDIYPSPRVAPFSNRDKPLKRGVEPLVLSSLGPARFEKGIDLLQNAIKACFAQGLSRPVKFVIQWNHPILDDEGKPYEPDPELLADPRVEFITRGLDSAEYDAAIEATDFMLLPYQRASYYARISGVAVEAATAGIPMLYTRDTWNSDLVDICGAGIGWDDGDQSGLIKAIGHFADNYQAYHDAAMARRADAQAAHSSGAFMAILWGKK